MGDLSFAGFLRNSRLRLEKKAEQTVEIEAIERLGEPERQRPVFAIAHEGVFADVQIDDAEKRLEASAAMRAGCLDRVVSEIAPAKRTTEPVERIRKGHEFAFPPRFFEGKERERSLPFLDKSANPRSADREVGGSARSDSTLNRPERSRRTISAKPGKEVRRWAVPR